jgi:hypothetical protein
MTPILADTLDKKGRLLPACNDIARPKGNSVSGIQFRKIRGPDFGQIEAPTESDRVVAGVSTFGVAGTSPGDDAGICLRIDGNPLHRLVAGAGGHILAGGRDDGAGALVGSVMRPKTPPPPGLGKEE